MFGFLDVQISPITVAVEAFFIKNKFSCVEASLGCFLFLFLLFVVVHVRL